MSSAVSLRKTVSGAIQSEFISIGFEKRKHGIFTLNLSEDVVGWIGLNTATRGQKGFMEVNPVVGIRNQRIERYVSNLVGESFDNLIPPTIAGHIGYLLPANRYTPYNFTEKCNIKEMAIQLVDAVKMYAIPFMKNMIGLSALVETMVSIRFGIAEQLNYRIPVAWYLLGNNQEAMNCLSLSLSKLATRNDDAAIRFKRFASNFSKFVKE